jgi:hypothetical protein
MIQAAMASSCSVDVASIEFNAVVSCLPLSVNWYR